MGESWYERSMSRRLAIIIAVAAVVVFCIVYFWPETARAGSTLHGSVGARLHLGDSGVRIGATTGGVRWSDGRPRHRSDGRWDHHRDWWKHGAPGPWRRWPRAVVVVPAAPQPPVIVRETIVMPPAPPPAPVEVLGPPAPLDPAGRARTVSVLGGGAPREWVLGAVLPPDIPYVTLAPLAFGLPVPPPGQIYIRVDGDVLRIEAGTRRILGVVAG